MRFGEDLTERQRAVAYYGTALLVTLFGFLGLLSIGAPILIVGVLLLALGPVRRQRDVLWPPLLGTAVFTFAFVVFAPYVCDTRPGGDTRCTSALGLAVPGGVVLGVLGSLTLGLLAAVALRAAMRRRSRVRA